MIAENNAFLIICDKCDKQISSNNQIFNFDEAFLL